MDLHTLFQCSLLLASCHIVAILRLHLYLSWPGESNLGLHFGFWGGGRILNNCSFLLAMWTSILLKSSRPRLAPRLPLGAVVTELRLGIAQITQWFLFWGKTNLSTLVLIIFLHFHMNLSFFFSHHSPLTTLNSWEKWVWN